MNELDQIRSECERVKALVGVLPDDEVRLAMEDIHHRLAEAMNRKLQQLHAAGRGDIANNCESIWQAITD
jgi:hypothetical protein